MELNNYQKEAHRTARYVDIGEAYVYPTLGLVGEAGELANKVKKIFRDRDGKIDEETKNALMLELGDILWYVAEIATVLGVPLEEVAEANLQKLASRKEREVIGGSGDNR
ncbi:MAG: nucleoside triphosphate pyrophosphohydrolase family protein [Nanoarchaeota archaeon]|nr:nucleoside triphosphate pyrophosphohydrolase family protein [Nanoarchaeota archaeon]